MEFDLALVWAGLIAFAILAYVILDGFDLGAGILFPFFKGKKDRDTVMDTVAPFWDGNETWLVLGGGGLLSVFPLAYSILMPALYVPVIAMLIGLIYRGVAFEFRWRLQKDRSRWDAAFCAGSVLAAFSQGVALGAVLQGIEVSGRAYSGGTWDFLTPFSVLTGVALVIGYALLGATWMVMKTDGAVQARARFIASVACIAAVVLIGLCGLLIPFLNDAYYQRWFSGGGVLLAILLPVLAGVAAWVLYSSLRSGRDAMPFFAALALFVVGYAGILISLFPFMVPASVTIWQAAAPDTSLKFLLIGASVLIPMILAYTAFTYWAFRGKVDPDRFDRG